MIFNSLKIPLSGVLALTLLSCSGGSPDNELPIGSTDSPAVAVTNPDANVDLPVIDVPPAVVDTEAQAAARLLAQATFGPTLKDIEEVKRLGIDGWLENQFSLKGASQLSYSRSVPGSGSLSGPRQHKWLLDAIDGEDQLRQRVAFAYSEIFVTSDVSQTLTREQYAMAN